MDYELAKSLMDAEFPQIGKGSLIGSLDKLVWRSGDRGPARHRRRDPSDRSGNVVPRDHAKHRRFERLPRRNIRD